jgi:hypothetical protein
MGHNIFRFREFLTILDGAGLERLSPEVSACAFERATGYLSPILKRTARSNRAERIMRKSGERFARQRMEIPDLPSAAAWTSR